MPSTDGTYIINGTNYTILNNGSTYIINGTNMTKTPNGDVYINGTYSYNYNQMMVN